MKDKRLKIFRKNLCILFGVLILWLTGTSVLASSTVITEETGISIKIVLIIVGGIWGIASTALAYVFISSVNDLKVSNRYIVSKLDKKLDIDEYLLLCERCKKK